MKITSVEYHKSVAIHQETVLFEGRKEVCFVGRSNVGKSSLLNALFQKKNMAFTSATPGKTRTANMFLINGKCFVTDLPGYGYAKRGKENQDSMDGLISWYLEEKQNLLVGVVLLVDSKIGPQESDIAMYQYIKSLELPILIVLTKIDKHAQSQVNKMYEQAQKIFFGENILLVSSQKKIGVDKIVQHLSNWKLC